VLIPGHGSVTDAPGRRYDDDRRYLDDLLGRGSSEDPRIVLAGMPELHQENLERARAGRCAAQRQRNSVPTTYAGSPYENEVTRREVSSTRKDSAAPGPTVRSYSVVFGPLV
jgi:hypothetical protein